jgi:hypothetical protein
MGHRHLGNESDTRCPAPQCRSEISVDVDTLMKKLRLVARREIRAYVSYVTHWPQESIYQNNAQSAKQAQDPPSFAIPPANSGPGEVVVRWPEFAVSLGGHHNKTWPPR